jgi:recombination protein RecR
MHYPDHLLKLIQVFKRLPGVGTKSAERFAFQLLDWSEDQIRELGDTISQTKAKLHFCSICGCLMRREGCFFCLSTQRNRSLLCILATPRDVFAIEETGQYHGLYHVLGGLLSPLHRKGPEHLSLKQLQTRLDTTTIQEVVIALDSTLEGDATALFLKQELSRYPIQISRLAFGLPMGSSLDYVDGGTLTRAFLGRQQF